MLTPLPPPPPPRDLGPRLQRLGAQAAAIVLLGLFGFGLAGLVVDTDTEPTAAPSTAGPTADDVASPTAPTTTTDQATDDGVTPTESAPSGATPATPTSPASSEAPTSEPPSAEPTTASPSDDRLDPSTIRIQVLDGVGDGGATANRVAGELREAGYNVVVVNQASRRYDETTVFYTDGQSAAAQQVAGDMGFPVVAPKPDNLSSAVELHVVVGTDEA